MDYELNEDQKRYKDEFGRFCTDVIAPLRWAVEKGGARGLKAVKTAYRALGGFGYLGLCFSECWGGRGQDLVLQTSCDETLAKISPSIFLSVYTSSVHCGKLIEQFGSEELKKSVLHNLLRGRRMASMARTEAGAGTDLTSIATTLVRTSDGELRVTGHKDFCVNAPLAALFIVVGQRAEGHAAQDPERRLAMIAIPSKVTGLEIGEAAETVGYRGLPIARLRLNSCTVPDWCVLGAEKDAHVVLEASFEWDAIGITSASVGIMTKALEASLAYSKDRQVLGKPIGSFQEVSFKLAEMRAMLDTARVLSAKAAWLKQEGDAEARVLLSCAKLYASEAASRCASYAIQIHGGHGIYKDSPVAGLYDDAKCCEIAGGTSEIHRLAIAQSVLNAVG